MDPARTPQALEPVRQAMLAGNKILAIKLYREITHAGFAEAKRAVEELEPRWRASAAAQGVPAPDLNAGERQLAHLSLTPEQLDAIRRALAAHEKLEAIKLYRDATNVGLAEAKHAVEALETQWTGTGVTASGPAAKGPGVSKPFSRAGTGSGCFGLLLIGSSGLGTAIYAVFVR